jgi:transcriptional regulator with XRE-family HTH domain
MTPRVTLRRKRLERAMKLHGIETDAQLAAALGMNRSTAGRLRSGEIQPGRESIPALLRAFPELTYEDLFEAPEPVRRTAVA